MKKTTLALFALALWTATALTLPREASAQQAGLTGDLPDSGIGLAVWDGGSPDAFIDAAALSGCGVVSLWVTLDGDLLGYRPGAPAFVNAGFMEEFDGDVPAGPVLAICTPADEVEENEPTTVSPTLGDFVRGTAQPRVPAGAAGVVSVVATGAFDVVTPTDGIPASTTVSVAVVNNTASTVYRVQITAVARSASGTVLADGDDLGMQPVVIAPGGIAFGQVLFAGAQLPASAVLSYEVTSTPLADATGRDQWDLAIAQHALIGTGVTGTARNDQASVLQAPFTVIVACFSTAGEFLRVDDGLTDLPFPGTLVAGGTTMFNVSVANCPTYLATVRGSS